MVHVKFVQFPEMVLKLVLSNDVLTVELVERLVGLLARFVAVARVEQLEPH